MLWRVEQPAHVLTLTGHLQGLSDAAWAPDGRYLCTASDDQTVRVFDCTTGQVLRTFRGHQSYVCCCAYSPRGNIVASGSYDETIKLWDVRTARCLRSFGSHSDPITGLDFSWDGSLLASSSFDGLCRVWDAVAGTCIKTLLVDSNPFAFVVHKPRLPFRCCSLSHHHTVAPQRDRTYVKFTPNSKYLLASYLDSTLRLWCYERAQCLREFTGHTAAKYSAAAAFLCSSATGNCVVCGSEDGRVCVWDVDRAALRTSWDAHTTAVLGVDCHPTQPLVATGAMGPDSTVKLWSWKAAAQ